MAETWPSNVDDLDCAFNTEPRDWRALITPSEGLTFYLSYHYKEALSSTFVENKAGGIHSCARAQKVQLAKHLPHTNDASD